MLKVNFFHVCENAVIEQGTGNISLIGMFQNINAQSFPAMHPVMVVVVGFENNNPGIYDVELVFSDSKGEIMKTTSKVNIGVNGKGNWLNKIALYQIPREETQKIDINYEGKNIYSGSLTVNNK